MDNLGAELSDILPSCDGNSQIKSCHQTTRSGNTNKASTEESGTRAQATSDDRQHDQRTHTEEKTSTKTTLATAGEPIPAKAPDSGWAWVVLIGVFFGLILTDGIFWSLGVFLVVWQDQISESITELQWIVSLLVALAHLTGRCFFVALGLLHNKISSYFYGTTVKVNYPYFNVIFFCYCG